MGKQIEIRIYPDGRVEANTKGIVGKSCADLVPVMEKMLEAKTTSLQYTDAYYQTENQQEIDEVEEVIL